jgi:thiol:disulfide interchange protein DsbC
MLLNKILAVILIVLLPSVTMAMTQKGHGGKCSACHSLSVVEASRLLKELGGTVKNTNLSPVGGLFEITLEKDGREIVTYVAFDKKHIVPSPIFSIATGKPITDTSVKQSMPIKRIDINRIPKTRSIVMGNPKGKNRLFVFTDPDCPFCAKLHAELKKLVTQDHSLAIYIKLFPLPMHPQAYDKARVILGRNSAALLDKVFAGLPSPPPTLFDSRKPVDETIRLATSFGISATPTLVLPDGRVITGYRDAETLLGLIREKSRRSLAR